ncbi:unnamed protein product, partial [Vitis vinifera]
MPIPGESRSPAQQACFYYTLRLVSLALLPFGFSRKIISDLCWWLLLLQSISSREFWRFCLFTNTVVGWSWILASSSLSAIPYPQQP